MVLKNKDFNVVSSVVTVTHWPKSVDFGSILGEKLRFRSVSISVLASAVKA